jgi:hypothetical protein
VTASATLDPVTDVARAERVVSGVLADRTVTRVYGAILGACHALTGISWISYKGIASLVTGEDCVCWPLWPGCEEVRAHLSPRLVLVAVGAYVGLGVASALLFALERTRAAIGVFLAATALGVALYALDYRLRSNQVYMLSWTVAAFLVAPRKSRSEVLQALVALFYVWAGTLKLNTDWVSGADLYEQPLFVPRALTMPACIYVILLELVLVGGLFASSGRWRWATYGQLIVFHAVSWKVIGFYYPVLMFGLTAIYPLVWMGDPTRTLTWARLGAAEPGLRAPIGITAALFSVVQIVPRVAFPGDTARTGEGRIFALHMFDARIECTGGAVVRSLAGGVARVPLIAEGSDVRSRCDPIILGAEARRLCRLVAARPGLTRVDVAIDAKRSSDVAMRPLIRVTDLVRRVHLPVFAALARLLGLQRHPGLDDREGLLGEQPDRRRRDRRGRR